MSFRPLGRKHHIALGIGLLAALACAVAGIWSIKNEFHYLNRADRIAFLVDELTVTPARQQRAMDEIVKDENGAFIYLLRHLDDRRSLAERDVLFLNTHPNAFEQYFHAGGAQVGETVLRYLCWKSGRCDVGFDVNDVTAIKIQRQKIEQYCRQNFIEPAPYRGT